MMIFSEHTRSLHFCSLSSAIAFFSLKMEVNTSQQLTAQPCERSDLFPLLRVSYTTVATLPVGLLFKHFRQTPTSGPLHLLLISTCNCLPQRSGSFCPSPFLYFSSKFHLSETFLPSLSPLSLRSL